MAFFISIGIQLFDSLTIVQHGIIVQSDAEKDEYRGYASTFVSRCSYLYCQPLLPESQFSVFLLAATCVLCSVSLVSFLAPFALFCDHAFGLVIVAGNPFIGRIDAYLCCLLPISYKPHIAIWQPN